MKRISTFLISLVLAVSSGASAQQTISGKTIRPETTPLDRLEQQPANTILGNCTGTPADVTACSAAAAKASLGLAPVASSGSASDLTSGTLATAHGGTGADLSAAGAGRYPKANGSAAFIASSLAAAGVGSCSNQFITALLGDAAPTCTTPTLAGPFFANQGTASTVLHGNAGGNPSFGAVSSSDLSITTTSCSNQFVTAIGANGVGTCTTDNLAGAQHANQGTTTTVLHGNAAGNPAFSAIVDGDFSGLLGLAHGGTGADLSAAGAGRYPKANGSAAFIASSLAAAGVGSCSNQFITALLGDAAPTCTTPTLAGPFFANQGTTSTVLHGNAVGNPSFGAVTDGDFSGTLGNAHGGAGGTTGILKAVSGSVSAAVSGTDYAPATSGSAVQRGNAAGGFSAYAGTSCTNQFPRSLDANAAATCNTVTAADQSTMGDATVKGRALGAGTGNETDLTRAQVSALLNAATTSLQGAMSAADRIKLDGAYKDAVADCGFSASGAAISDATWQACYDSFPATGGVLYFPAGTFDLALSSASTISVSKPVISKGSGRAISVIQISHATKTAFTSTAGSQGMGFEQLRFAAPLSTTRTAGFAWDMAAIANTYAQQIDCIYQWSCVHSAGALQFIDDANFREGGANAASGQFVLIESTGDRYIRRLTTDNPSDPTTFAGIRVRECSSLVITDSNIINSTNALDIVPNAGAGHAVASVLVVNTFFDSSVIGLNILPASNNDTAHRIRIVNSWFGSNTTANVRMGNGTIPNANIASIDFIGDDFFSNTTTPFGIDDQGSTDWSIRGSRLCGHTTNAIKIGVGTGTADHRFSITDNLIGSCLGVAANAQAITVGAGTYGQYQVLDNRGFDTNTTPGISDSGSVGVTGFKNISNNMGALLGGSFQFVNSGAAAVIAPRGVATSGTADTFLLGVRIPANSVSVGQMFRLTFMAQSTSTGTLITRSRAGAACTIAGDTVLSVSNASGAGVANTRWIVVEAWYYVIALGPTATIGGTISQRLLGNGTLSGSADAVEVTANVPTTGVFYLSVSGTASIAGWTIRSATFEVM